tara:strand:+ start:3861 stop:5402 length:1542 start_codon:yes stop_codon:yes gene_type:complete
MADTRADNNASASRPNVLLITTDQQRGDCVGYGLRGVCTPHIDALAARGTRFDTCITPSPMCQVARSSILTGKLPYDHGVPDNGYDLDPAEAANGLGGLFAKNGYRSMIIGKAHFATHLTFEATGQPECFKSVGDYDTNWRGPYYGFDHAELCLRPHLHTKWSRPPQSLAFEDWLDQDGKGDELWSQALMQDTPETKYNQVWRSSLNEEFHSTSWCGDRAVDALTNDEDTPFFCWLSFPDPHPPFVAPRPWSTTYDPAGVDLPEHRILDLDKRVWWHSAFLEGKAKRAEQSGLAYSSGAGFDDEDLRAITSIYYGMIEAIDAQIGRVLNALDASGALENTIVIFTSDHGEWLGDHGLLLKGPMLYDGLLRVPLVIAGPGVPEGVISDSPVSTLDLRTTLADLCGIEASADSGASLLPVMTGDEVRDHAYGEWKVESARSGIDLDLRTVRTRRYRMSFDMLSGAGELYDLETDPQECHDLMGDPSMSHVRKDLIDIIRNRKSFAPPASARVGWY